MEKENNIDISRSVTRMEKESNIDISRSVSDVVAAARVLQVLNEKTFSWFHMRIIIIAGMGT